MFKLDLAKRILEIVRENQESGTEELLILAEISDVLEEVYDEGYEDGQNS